MTCWKESKRRVTLNMRSFAGFSIRGDGKCHLGCFCVREGGMERR